ncbi:MAG: peptidase [Gemmatimonadetes bacterium]|nr:peptidase [Gemmatimonadota bacterium]
MSSLQRVIRAAAGQVWAILPDKLDEIAAFLELRGTGGTVDAEQLRIVAGNARPAVLQQGGGVAVLPMYGTMSRRLEGIAAFSGGVSCEKFGQRFDALVDDASVGTIVIRCDSPGGSVLGVPELSRKIFEARAAKKIIAHVDPICASAAYWAASAAHEIVITPSGQVPALGAFMLHVDTAGYDAEHGFKQTIIRYPLHKAEGFAGEPLSPEALAYLVNQVTIIGQSFEGDVARNMGLTPEEVHARFGQGRTMLAEEALAAGVVHRISTFEDLLAELGVSASALVSEASAQGAGALGSGRMAARRGEPGAASAPRAEGWEEDGEVCPDCGVPLEEDGDGVLCCPDCGRGGEDVEGRFAGLRLAALLPTDGLRHVLAQGASATLDVDASTAGGAAAARIYPPATPPAHAAKESTMPVPGTAATAASGTEDPTRTVRASAGADRGAELQRAAQIRALCDGHGIVGEAAEYIATPMAAADVGADIARRFRQNIDAMRNPLADLSPRDGKRFSMVRAILGEAHRNDVKGEVFGSAAKVDDAFEREVAAEIQRNLPSGYAPRGILLPTMLPSASVVAVQSAGTATKGAEMVFTQGGEFIDLLRPRMRLGQLGITVLNGLKGNVALPKQTGSTTAVWIGENPGADVADSDTSYTQVALNAKTVQISTGFTRQFLVMNTYGGEGLVQDDLYKKNALEFDRVGIAGNASGSTNEPTGVLYTSGVNSVPVGTNGGAPTWATIVDLETAITDSNADIGKMGYLSTPGIRGKLKQTARLGNTIAQAIWEGDEVNGYTALSSKQVPQGLTKGTSSDCHAIAFGVWSELVMGYWNALDVIVDPYTKKKQGIIELTSFAMVGTCLRHPEAFSKTMDGRTA